MLPVGHGLGAAGTGGLQGGETEAPRAQTRPPVYQFSGAWAPNWGWTHPTSPGGPQRRAWHVCVSPRCPPKSPPPRGKPGGGGGGGSESQRPGCGRAPKAAQEFLPGARLPPKMLFPPGMCGAEGGCGPRPPPLPLPSRSCCPSPARGPPLAASPRRVSQLLSCSRFPARRPPSSCRFFSRLSQHQALSAAV